MRSFKNCRIRVNCRFLSLHGQIANLSSNGQVPTNVTSALTPDLHECNTICKLTHLQAGRWFQGPRAQCAQRAMHLPGTVASEKVLRRAHKPEPLWPLWACSGTVGKSLAVR